MTAHEITSARAAPLTARQGCAWLLGLMRFAVRALSLLSLIWILVVMAALQWVGHKNPTVAFLMFLPAWLWAIPLLIMLFPALLVDTIRSGILTLLAVVFYLGPFLGYRWGSGSEGEAPRGMASLRVMTFNRGQSQGTSLQPFKNQWKPDILALQDSGGRVQQYLGADGYQEFTHGASVGEFVLLSKFPILASEIVRAEIDDLEKGGKRQYEIGGRFELDWNGTRVVVYSAHLPTHRGMLLAERNGGFLAGVLGLPGTPWSDKRRRRQEYWNVPLEQVRQLSERVGRETLPTFLVGDLNNPPYGPFYSTLTQHLLDSQAEEGSGYGYTFPGTTNNPLALFRPWLRIDYLFHSKGQWMTLKHVAEPHRGSQHRAVFAEFGQVHAGR